MPKNARQPIQKPRKRRGSVDKIAMNRTPVSDAVTHSWAWWEASHLLDDLDSGSFEDRGTALLTACGDLDIADVGALFTNAGPVIAAAADTESLVRYASAPQRHLSHRTRNFVTALLWTVAQREGLNPCPIIDDMPAITPRVAGEHRPAYDDEILLLRLRSLYRLQRPPKLAAPGVMYALTEAGAWAIESTHTTVSDFDDPARPTTVRVRANAARIDTSGRELELPLWARPALGPALARLKERDPVKQRCVFLGDHSNKHHSDSVTSTQTMTRAIEDVGLEARLTPREIVYWRAGHTARSRGEEAAVKVLGFTGDEALARLQTSLRPRSPERPTQTRKVRSYRGL